MQMAHMIRSEFYLTEEQRQKLAHRADSEDVSAAALVRQAIDSFFARRQETAEAASTHSVERAE